MSRGLGKLQTSIIEELRRRGEWRWSTDVVWGVSAALYRAGHDGDEPYYQDNPSRAFEVAVRRAADGLVRRGLIVAGSPEFSQERFKVAWWLPEHQPPKLKRRIPMALVENAIVMVLSKTSEADAAESFEFGKQAIRNMANFRRPGDVSYEHLVGEVTKAVARNRWEQDGLRVQIHRAVYKLQSQGRICLTWYATRRIGAVRLLL